MRKLWLRLKCLIGLHKDEPIPSRYRTRTEEFVIAYQYRCTICGRVRDTLGR